jgi:alcohol dehydrogenase class IV
MPSEFDFEFATATRIVFGAGTRRQVAPAAAALGQRVLLVGGQRPGPADALAAELVDAGRAVERLAVAGEPEVEAVAAGAAQARAAGVDVVVAIGGGSALDTGKAIAALLTNPGDLFEYLEGVGRGQALAHPSAPFIAVPTTAGTGAEVTRNAVLAVPDQRVKVSLRSPHMLPRLAVVDPELTYSLPLAVTASAGLDALAQLIEPFVSNAANPLTDAICREGLPRAAGALRRAYHAGVDVKARAEMSLASTLSGLALANARLGAVHGLAGPLGGWLPVAPHGALCARLLPAVTAANIGALLARAPSSPALARYAEVAQALTGRPAATLAEGVAWLRDLVADLNVPALGAYGLSARDIPELVPLAQKANSMRGNPIPLTDAEVAEVLRQAL